MVRLAKVERYKPLLGFSMSRLDHFFGNFRKKKKIFKHFSIEIHFRNI